MITNNLTYLAQVGTTLGAACFLAEIGVCPAALSSCLMGFLWYFVSCGLSGD